MSIILTKVCKTFGADSAQVLTDISFSIQQGEFVSLTGRSGSGKSTLLYVMSSLDNPTTGTVEIGGRILAKMNQTELHALRNSQIGFVFQFHYLLPELSAFENVLMPAMKTRQSYQREEWAKELLGHFGLEQKMHRLPHQLSGGEQQRVAIARALVMRPTYLFADEPTGSLDSVNGEVVMRILQDINKTQKTTIVLVTHEADYAVLARRQIHLADGKIVSDSMAG